MTQYEIHCIVDGKEVTRMVEEYEAIYCLAEYLHEDNPRDAFMQLGWVLPKEEAAQLTTLSFDVFSLRNRIEKEHLTADLLSHLNNVPDFERMAGELLYPQDEDEDEDEEYDEEEEDYTPDDPYEEAYRDLGYPDTPRYEGNPDLEPEPEDQRY